MPAPDLSQQQRDLLHQFRTANRQRTQAETEAETRHKTERVAADTALDQAQKAAEAQQAKARADAEARRKAKRTVADTTLNQVRQTGDAQLIAIRKAQEVAQTLLAQAGLQHLLEQTPANPPASRPDVDPSKELASHAARRASIRKASRPNADPSKELARAVTVATDTVKGMPDMMETLRRRREADAARRRLLAILAGVVVIILVIVAFVRYPSWQEARRVRQAQATATAEVVQAQATATAIAASVQATAIAKAPALQPLIGRFGMQFVEVPTGEFIIGSADGQGQDDEHPQHTISLGDFWIGLTEVTNAQYHPFIEAGGYTQPELWTADGWMWRQSNNVTKPQYWDDTRWNTPDQPVVGVSWYEAVAYTRWLARETGLKVRLPSEAEWEKAARGVDRRLYPWGNQEPTTDLANFNNNTQVRRTAVVGSYPRGASPYGALDMAGNVWEWTNNLYMDYPYQQDNSRENPDTRGTRVLRGGSWLNPSSTVRAAWRGRFDPDKRYDYLGFRVAVSPGL